MQKLVLSAKNIQKKFLTPTPLHVLENVSLDLYEGTFATIKGKSGEGKSTLLHILGTLEKPSCGTIEIDGIDTTKTDLPRLRSEKIGFVFQAFHLLEDYTVLNNILMPARIARKSIVKGSDSYHRAIKLLEQIDLHHKTHTFAKLLSGGEKQRVAIARALINNPSLIFADEPFGNLDRSNSQSVQKLFLELCKKENKALLIVTHDEDLSSLADRSFTLKEGKLL